MLISLRRFVILTAALSLGVSAARAQSYYQPYSFRTLAGVALGNVDGVGTSARLRTIACMATDAAGNIYMADASESTIRKMTPDGHVTTIAGLAGNVGAVDGKGAAARFRNPRGVAVDASGNVFVTDTGNHTVRLITPDGTVSTFAGDPGVPSYRDGTGIIARFNTPTGIVWVNSGLLFVVDAGNACIRQITSAKAVSTLAGNPGHVGTNDGTKAAALFYHPTQMAADTAGNLYVTEPQVFTVRKITQAGVVTTIAGTAGVSGDTDANGKNARFNTPVGVTTDLAKNVYVTDSSNRIVRKISPANDVTTFVQQGPFAGVYGIVFANGTLFVADQVNGTIDAVSASGSVSIFAGTVSAGLVDGTGTAARFSNPQGIAVDASGNAFVADTENASIRRVTPDGQVTTIATNASQLKSSQGVTVDSAGNIYVANTGAHTISKIAPGGTPTIFAGSAGVTGSSNGKGTAAGFSGPVGVAADTAGNVYVADTQNQTIRKITPDGTVSTLAGNANVSGDSDGTGSNATFGYPEGVAVDHSGNVYVADTSNSLIRKITPAGVVTTIAGMQGAFGSADGPGTKATFSYPVGIAVDAAGNLYVGEQVGETIRKIAPDHTVTTIAGTPRVEGSSDGVGGAATFSTPLSVAVDGSGKLYVADSGNNTVRVSSAGPVAQLLNISTRGLVQTDNNVLIGGVIAIGGSSKNVIVRAIGPSLANAGVQGALGDPMLELHDSSGALVASNDDWKTDSSGKSQQSAIQATGIAPSNNAESALTATLNAYQNYTVVVRGKNNTTGVALVEAYDLNPTAGSILGNISTRGYVDINNALIGGLIVGNQSGATNVLARGLGPSLTAAGVSNALTDPTLELRDVNGALLAGNDNWQDTNATAIQATGIPPSDPHEAAILAMLAPGNYTAVVQGKGASGIGLVEVYNLQQ